MQHHFDVTMTVDISIPGVVYRGGLPCTFASKTWIGWNGPILASPTFPVDRTLNILTSVLGLVITTGVVAAKP